jgi:MFS family permease
MQLQLTSLWRHADFLKLWAGQTISLVGSKITFLALPLTAILVLEITPAQMGLLTVAETLPALLVGLFAGAWVDRTRHRPVMIAADIGRGLLLLLIPVMAIFGLLRIELLYLIGFLVGTLSLFFGIAYHAFLPTLLGRAQLIEGNSKLGLSRSAAEIVGPGLAGGLVQLFTAPVALLVDALSFLVSAIFLALIRTPEPAHQPVEAQENIWHDIRAGLRLVAGDPTLRAVAACHGAIDLFNSMLEAVWLLYLVRGLSLEPGLLGLISTGGGLGFLVGAMLPGPVIRRFGLGPAIIGSILLCAGGDLLTSLAGGPVSLIAVTLLSGQFLFGIGLTIYSVSQTSLTQSVTPGHLLGRVNATMSVLNGALIPLGGLLGGLLGELIGLRLTLVLAALGEMSAVLWLLWSPVRSVREMPE